MDTFQVRLRSTGQTVTIAEGTSILEGLEAHGYCVPSLCREGACGTCLTAVLSGIPDHRDQVLSEEDKASNQSIVLCVSRSRSALLELDL